MILVICKLGLKRRKHVKQMFVFLGDLLSFSLFMYVLLFSSVHYLRCPLKTIMEYFGLLYHRFVHLHVEPVRSVFI